MASFADVEAEVAVLKVKDTEVYKAAAEVKLEVDASAIVEARAMVGGRDDSDLPGVKWCSFDKFLAAAVRAMAAARARGDDRRLFSAETLAAALINGKDVLKFGSTSIWPFLDLLKKRNARACQVRSKLAGVLDGGADEYTLPSREEVEAKRNDARAAAAANAPPPPPPPPAPRGRSTRTKRDPRAGWD